MPTPETAYRTLTDLWRQASLLASCADVLDWDSETFLPRGGVANRSEQSAALAGLVHERRTDRRLGDLLCEVEASDLAHDEQGGAATNIREIRREYDRLTRLPPALVQERARLMPLAQQAWAEAKDENDFARLAPWLGRCVATAREEGLALTGGGDAMDGLLGQYEPGLQSSQVRALLEPLTRELTTLLAEIRGVASPGRRPGETRFLRREYPIERQRLFAQAVAASLGFDLECGRLDVGAHPSCMHLGPGDIRLTARYAERTFGRGFFAVLHEVGHALYDQGLPTEHHGLPLGQAPSLGAHESQARLWENFVGRGPGFWAHFFPRLRNVFPEALGDVDLEGFLAGVNRVESTPLRAEADEVTYNLHVSIRFELERGLISGELPVAELPGAWAEAHRRVLGLAIASDAEGCLQDGHWAACMFGYFPTYALGNMHAAQLMSAARAELGDLEEQFALGEFSPLLDWLRDRVHRHGHRWSTPELMRRATGREPTHADLLAHLRARYLPRG